MARSSLKEVTNNKGKLIVSLTFSEVTLTISGYTLLDSE